MVINEIKREKYNLMFLGLFAIIAILIFQQSQISVNISEKQTTNAEYLKHTFNQSLNNFDGIIITMNTTKENHQDHQKELANQKIILNQTLVENKLLSSINKTLGIIITANNITNIENNSNIENQTLKHNNATLIHYN